MSSVPSEIVKAGEFIDHRSGPSRLVGSREEAVRSALVLPQIEGSVSEYLGWWSAVLAKRLMDIAIVLITLPIVLLVGLLIVLAMLPMRGPLFYSQWRIKRDGKMFRIWKFRSMYVDSSARLQNCLETDPRAREEWRHKHKLQNDPRVTPVGCWLRKTSLDELPQVWNILRGDMSVVGPRAIRMDEAFRYGDDFAYYLAVRPGLTGLWQVSGRSRLSYDERVQLDREYVENWSVWNDVKILARTFGAVMDVGGAY